MTQPQSPVRPDPRSMALALLARVQSAFDATLASLAQACARGGALDAALLDAQQGACYEIALANADLLAARTALMPSQDAAGDAPDALDDALGIAFAAEAIAAIVARLESISIDLGADTAGLHAIASDPAHAACRSACSSSAALARLGAALAASNTELGRIALDDSVALAQDAFRRFAREVVAPQAEAIHRSDLTVPETLLQPMREMGVFGLSIPQAYGGSASGGREDATLMMAVTEALSQASLAAAGSLITRPEILARALLAGGTEAQKSHWLPLVAAGDPLCAIAITEPDFGSDVASLSLRATKCEGGWLLDGAKTWCTFAGKAGLLMVVARTDPDRRLGHRGLSILLVEKRSFEGHAFSQVQDGGGRLSGRAIPTIGYRGMHSFDLAFERWFVPDDGVVGGPAGLGRGFYFTMAGMTGGRLQTAARALGVMRAALAAALSYAQDRRVFDAPLADFALTRIKLARMAARFVACRRLAYAVGRMMDRGDARMEASLVKLLACRSAEFVTREALQIHGGMGYAEETPVSRYFVDARVLSIFEGAEETLALKVVARSLLEAALAGASHA